MQHASSNSDLLGLLQRRLIFVAIMGIATTRANPVIVPTNITGNGEDKCKGKVKDLLTSFAVLWKKQFQANIRDNSLLSGAVNIVILIINEQYHTTDNLLYSQFRQAVDLPLYLKSRPQWVGSEGIML